MSFPGGAARLAPIVVNLLNNAAKCTPLGGQLEPPVGREGDRVRDIGPAPSYSLATFGPEQQSESAALGRFC